MEKKVTLYRDRFEDQLKEHGVKAAEEKLQNQVQEEYKKCVLEFVDSMQEFMNKF